MPDSMTKQSKNDRREMVLKALQDANKSALAADYGVSRQRLHALVREAETDPEIKPAEAEAEVAFRRRVLELLRRQ